MYYIEIELEYDVTEKDAKEVLEIIKSLPEVAQAKMEGDDDDK
jgi:hypothetical protein